MTQTLRDVKDRNPHRHVHTQQREQDRGGEPTDQDEIDFQTRCMQEGLELFRDAGVVTPELNQQPHAIVSRHQLFWVPESSIISSTSLISSYRQNCHRPARTSERGPQPPRRPRATGFPVCSVFAELIWLSAIAARCGRFQPIVPGLLGCRSGHAD